jgi:hypothetical protein
MISNAALQSLQNLQEYVILCRPRDVTTFAVRYFKDEQLPYPTVLHAYHCLPYLLFEESSFQAYTCIVFSHELSLLGPTHDTLDTSTVLRAIQNMSSEDFFVSETIQQVSIYGKLLSLGPLSFVCTTAQVISEYIEPIQSFTFKSFVSAIRLPLCCFVLASWANRIFEEYRLLFDNPSASTADCVHLQAHVAKRYRTSIVCCIRSNILGIRTQQAEATIPAQIGHIR